MNALYQGLKNTLTNSAVCMNRNPDQMSSSIDWDAGFFNSVKGAKQQARKIGVYILNIPKKGIFFNRCFQSNKKMAQAP